MSEFIGNVYDPRRKDARARFYDMHRYHGPAEGKGTSGLWRRHLKWIDDHDLREPVATHKFTSVELAGMGLLGLYRP